MEKETLTLESIAKDLNALKPDLNSRVDDRGFMASAPLTVLALVFGFYLKIVWIALVLAAISLGLIIEYIIRRRRFNRLEKPLDDSISRDDISISVEVLSHIATETIVEPHSHGKHSHYTKTVLVYYFTSGIGWRVPYLISRHYAWSKTHYLSTKGLQNISVEGNEFFYVSLQGYPDLTYIYPCKLFMLDPALTVNP